MITKSRHGMDRILSFINLTDSGHLITIDRRLVNINKWKKIEPEQIVSESASPKLQTYSIFGQDKDDMLYMASLAYLPLQPYYFWVSFGFDKGEIMAGWEIKAVTVLELIERTFRQDNFKDFMLVYDKQGVIELIEQYL